jgi:hypothetical protein
MKRKEKKKRKLARKMVFLGHDTHSTCRDEL